MRRAIIQQLGSLSAYRYGVDTYDSSKLGLGPLIYQQSGSGEAGYAGPAAIAVARPTEQSTAVPAVFPWATRWQNTSAGEIDWVFLCDNATAAATRRIVAYTYDRTTSVWDWKGFITITFPTATAYTIRGFRMTYDLETTGLVSTTGTTVSGSGTLFSTNKICVGNRIGFGSTRPPDITTWYEISAINSDTSLTLTTVGPTLTSGTPFVVEDLRAILATTNATTTNGGLNVCKGLSFSQFSPIGGTVPAATTVDNIRATYWLADAATLTNTVTFGVGLGARTSATSQFVYVADTLANPIIYKYNVRAPLTLSAGKDTTAFQFKTGAGGAVTGTTSQVNNLRLDTAQHGPLSGVESLYFTTTSRVYGTAVSNITIGSTTWLSNGYVMLEVPPGGVNTFAAGGIMNAIDYSSAIDKFVITNNAATTPNRNYITQFRTDSGQFDRVWGGSNMQIDQTTADSSLPAVPSYTGGPFSAWTEGGLLYVAGVGTTSIINRVYAIPIGADWEYAETTKSRLVLPEILTPDANKYVTFFAQSTQVIGGKTGKNLGINTEPFRMYYRTSGISDDTGSWTLLDSTGVVSIDGAASVQLMIEFRTIGVFCIPARINTIGVVYDDITTDSHYQLSVGKSDLTNKRFAWRFATAFGTTVPELKVRLYDAVSGGVLVTDTTGSSTGTFQQSTDGSTWATWTDSDKTNNTTYIRYTPASLADNINVRAVLTLA